MKVRDCLAIAVFTVPLAACRGTQRHTPSEGNAGPRPAVVARVAGQPILSQEIAADAALRGVTIQAALDDRIALELFALAAQSREPTAPTRADRERLQSAEVERLLEREVEPRLRKSAIPEAEAQAVYDRAQKRFVHGRLVQIAVLCVFTGARLAAEPRARAQHNALLLRDHVVRHPGTAADFESLAKDPVWLARNVSFTTVWQDQSEPFPAILGEAASRLTRPGETTELVGDESGYYLARYISERGPENTSFAKARSEIETEMYEPWRRQKFLRLTLEMAQAHDVEVFPENFDQLAAAPAP